MNNVISVLKTHTRKDYQRGLKAIKATIKQSRLFMHKNHSINENDSWKHIMLISIVILLILVLMLI